MFTVAVNHLKSKGSGCGAGDDQPDHLGGNCNGTRTAAAEALADWLASDPTGSGDPDAMIIGDLNSYRMESPITALREAGFSDLLAEFEGPDAYTYVFMGASGYLDHAQATASFREQVVDAAPWHINTDEPTALDYNTNFKTANHVTSLYAPDPYRSSDHDPVMVGLDLQLHSKVTGGGTITTAGGRASFQLSAQYPGSEIVPSGTTTFARPGLDLRVDRHYVAGCGPRRIQRALQRDWHRQRRGGLRIPGGRHRWAGSAADEDLEPRDRCRGVRQPGRRLRTMRRPARRSGAARSASTARNATQDIWSGSSRGAPTGD